MQQFVDYIFLTSLAHVSPFDHMNFSASYQADYERFRNDKGNIYLHAAPVNMEHLEELVDHMHIIIEHSPELSCFRSFFFDSWYRGIKTALDQDTEHSVTDIEWALANHVNTFIDIAIEAIPSYGSPTVRMFYNPQFLDPIFKSYLLHNNPI